MRSRRRTIRRWAIIGSLAVAAVLTFKLFEPVFVWSYGWQPLPATAYPIVTDSSEDWSDVGAQAQAWLAAAREAEDAPALSAAVSIGGVRVWAGAVGYADVASGTPATLDTIFRLGSTSKAITSIAMGTLIARNAVDLDAPVSTYVPDLSAPLSTITTRQAMSHTAGVRNYALCFCFPIWEHWSRTHYEGPQREVLRPYEGDALLFPPGESFAYTSLGYNVAGAVIESVSGVSFREFLDREVFTPLGMHASRAATGRPIEGASRFYVVEDGRYKEAFRVDNTNKLPSGGLLSTPSDMVRLGAQMIEPTLFDRATRDLLMRPPLLPDGTPGPQRYGLGWRHESASPFFDGAATTERLHHHGTAEGSTSHFTVYPEYGMVVSVIMNRSQTSAASLGQQANRLAELFAAAIGTREEVTRPW